MLRWTMLVLAIGCGGAASLTWFHAPTIWLWRASVLVGEFGHFLFLLPLAIAGCAWIGGDAGVLRIVTVVLCVAASAAMWRPVILAASVAQTLPAKLGSAFGVVQMDRAPFKLKGLVARAATPVAIETRTVAGGQPLDFYRADGRTTPAPCVVIIHGGGWDNGTREQLPALNHHLARRGYAVAAVGYRLAPETRWPGQADDIAAALAHLKTHSDELGIDPTRLVLMGRSAGGQLAAAVAYRKPDTSIRGVVSFYGPHDQVFAWGFSREDDILNAVKLLRQYLGGTPETAAEAYRTASAYLIATKENAVPTLMVHGVQDPMVWHKQSERLRDKLSELGTPNALVSLPWATHGCDFNPRGPSGQLSWYALEWFLAAVTK